MKVGVCMRSLRSFIVVALCAVLCALAACGANTDTFPTNAAHPKPVAQVFQGCPAQGQGSDATLDTLENRVDDVPTSQYHPLSLDVLTALPNLTKLQGHARSTWDSADAQRIGQYEGVAIQTTGYVVAIRYVGAESVNCDSTSAASYYLWISNNASDPGELAMVVVITPRVQANRPGWTVATIRKLVGQYIRVRGWLLFDQQPSTQLGISRSTLWEIHPIMHIEVDQKSQWHSIDEKPL